ncbi:MAG: glycosyltransferase family 2 protein [Erysipelotrichaceae bacterium]|nr:glycosyltransferase family 2 protein [Erysipelotrichaceae bacterium]
MKEISIIVPIYNVEKYLRTCFESLINIDFDSYEVLAINDGSPDNSIEIMKEYQKKYPELIKIIDKENGGYGSVLERAIKEIESPYFIICDPDDTLNKNALSVLYKLIKENDCDIAVGAKTLFYEDSDERNYDQSFNSKFVSLKNEHVYLKGNKDFNDLYFLDPSPHSKLYKRSLALNIVFPKKVSYTDNLLFYICLNNSNSVIYTNEALANYLINRSGNTMTDLSLGAMQKQIFVFGSIIEESKKCENVPDMFYYRMFESFKYLWSIADRTKANKEEFSDVLNRLETFLISIDNYSKKIIPLYKEYSHRPILEKINDLKLLNIKKEAKTYNKLKTKKINNFIEKL